MDRHCRTTCCEIARRIPDAPTRRAARLASIEMMGLTRAELEDVDALATVCVDARRLFTADPPNSEHLIEARLAG